MACESTSGETNSDWRLRVYLRNKSRNAEREREGGSDERTEREMYTCRHTLCDKKYAVQSMGIGSGGGRGAMLEVERGGQEGHVPHYHDTARLSAK